VDPLWTPGLWCRRAKGRVPESRRIEVGTEVRRAVLWLS